MRKLLLLALSFFAMSTSFSQISTFPYLENFESGTGGFEAFNSTNGAQNGTWAFGTPNKAVIQGAASGDSAWTTGGLTGDYSPNDDSWVETPYFDFTTIDSGAYVSMKIWWESETSWDGSNLQASVDSATTWTNIGAWGDPNNWYNDNTLNANPGGSQQGWTGRFSNGSGGWVVASHDIPSSLWGQSSVKMRVTFGSDGSVQDEGFAFDDFAIGYPDSAAVDSMPDYAGCGPVIIDYGTASGFYNYDIVDTTTMTVTQYTANINDGYLEFNNTGTADTTFYVVMNYADPSGLNAFIDTVLITLSPPPSNMLLDTNICAGGTAIYSVATDSLYTYEWNNGSTTDSAIYTAGGLVQVIVTNTASTCADTAMAFITQGVAVDLIASAHICTGDVLTLDAGAGYDIYAWSTTDSTQTTIVNTQGNYTVTVMDSLGCTSSDTLIVTESLPMPTITGQIDTLCTYLTVGLDAGSGFDTYSWSTGGSAASETIDGSTLPLGLNTITVTVTDTNNCSNSDAVVIFVDQCLGFDELDGITMSIFPNPSTGIFNYEISDLTEEMTLFVTDVAGKVVVNGTLNSTNGTIDLSSFESGMYIVNLQIGDKTASVRLIKQ